MIALQQVSKIYRSLTGRRVAALREFSLSIDPGEVVGIAGPNGAGKSTLLSLILGYLHPTSGRVTVGGESPRRFVEHHGVGYLPEVFVLPPRWGVVEALRRFATLAGLGRSGRARIEEVIALTGLEEHRRKLVKQLSKGTLQRVGLAQALLAPRAIVVLDEPTHGLDPVWTQRFRDIVRDARSPERALLIASHNLDELERVADRVAIVHQGQLQRVVRSGGGGMEAGAATTFRLSLAAPVEGLEHLFPGATLVEGRPLEYRVRGDLAALNAGLAALLAQGGRLAGFVPEESGLEREFRAAIGGG